MQNKERTSPKLLRRPRRFLGSFSTSQLSALRYGLRLSVPMLRLTTMPFQGYCLLDFTIEQRIALLGETKAPDHVRIFRFLSHF